MTVIRVNPESMRLYATAAGEQFAAARTQLEQMVQAVADVHYQGPNALDFKTKSVQQAYDFSTALLADIRTIAEAVRASTTNIAASLGGGPLVIAVDGQPINRPEVVVDTTVYDVSTDGLEALTPVVTRHFGAVGTALDDHLTKLRETDWSGAAKDQAVAQVTTFTTNVKTKITEAEGAINRFIREQIDSVRAADK